MEILIILIRGEMTGYQIAQELLKRDPGLLAEGEGLIYPALERMEDLNWIKGEWKPAGLRRRRYYSLTKAGLARLARYHAEKISG